MISYDVGYGEFGVVFISKDINFVYVDFNCLFIMILLKLFCVVNLICVVFRWCWIMLVVLVLWLISLV